MPLVSIRTLIREHVEISERSARAKIASDDIPHYRVGRRVLIDVDEAVAALKGIAARQAEAEQQRTAS